MKVSLICTVKNEESTIKEFLDSVISQTKKPDEFIIVDGGSTDKTVDIIKQYKKSIKNLKLIIAKDANVAQGRNIAIKNARYKIIACTDAGCILNKNWLREITKYFPKKDVVVGNYKPLSKNDFEYFQGFIVVKKVDRPSRMSSRSIAFKKKCWKKVGGYPKDSLAGEDTKFNLNLVNDGCKIKIEPKAIVYWRMRPTLKAFAKQFYRYGRGDKEQGNLLRMKFNLLFVISFWFYLALILGFLFFNSLFSLILILLVIFYLLFYSLKINLKTKKISALYYIPLLLFIKRTAYVLGATFGR